MFFSALVATRGGGRLSSWISTSFAKADPITVSSKMLPQRQC